MKIIIENEVPKLDCSKIAGPLEGIENTKGFQEFAKELGDGLRQVGFVYFVNHGVDSKMINNTLACSRQFFQLPKEIKDKYRKVDAVESFFGYTAPQDEIAAEVDKSKPDFKEAFDVCDLRGFDESYFPLEAPQLKPAFDEFRSSCKLLVKKVLKSLALYLKLNDLNFFINHHKHLDDHSIITTNLLRSTYYLPYSDENLIIGEDDMRLTEHNDNSVFTFLFQDDCGGLEARKPDGNWVCVPPVKDSIVLNAGLYLEMWSGGYFAATSHRVRLLKESACKLRQSLAYFLQPDGDAKCNPVVPEKPDWVMSHPYPKMKKTETAMDYWRERIRGVRRVK